MPNLSSLSAAYSALVAHQRRGEVIAQNIANVDTPGYTRQRAELTPVGVYGGAGVIATTRPSPGVELTDIDRLTDDLLDQQARRATSTSTSLQQQTRVARTIEQRLGALGDDSLSVQLEALWSGFAEVANDPGSLPSREVVLQQAQRVAITMNQLATATVDDHRAKTEAVHQRVGEINDLAAGIATLNRSILAAQGSGAAPNELLDQQANLIDRLAEVVDITVSQRGSGSVNVYVDGHDLVSDGFAKPLAVSTGTDPALAAVGLDRTAVTVARAPGEPAGRPLALRGGQLHGLLLSVNETLPGHLGQLDALAAGIAGTVNAIHTTGAGLDGVAGRRLFDPDPPTARTLAVSADVAGDPRRIAAGEPGAGALDATVAQRLAALGDGPENPALAADRLAAAVGASVASLDARLAAAEGASGRARAAADAVSAVNLDEELTNLMESQRAFEAAARVLTTIDQMLDTLINRTGLVGR